MADQILIAGAGANQAYMIRCAREMGLRTIVMDANPDAPGMALGDVAVPADISDAVAVTEAARRHRVDGICPAAEWAVEASAHACAQLGLPGVSPEVATRMRNKLVMRDVLARAGLPQPAYRGVLDLDGAQRAAADIGFPVIVKPADGNASRGVQRVDYPEEIALAFAKAKKISRCGSILVEQFMDGAEFNIDGIVCDGVYRLGGMTGKHLSPPPHRYDRGIYMPPHVGPAESKAIEACAIAALDAAGFHTGATHVEVILTEDGPRLVEMAGRPGGGRIPTDLIPLAYGWPYMHDVFRVVLGQTPLGRPRFDRGAALFWLQPHSGVVEQVEQVDAVREMPGVVDLVVNVRPGDVLQHATDCVSRDRAGYVLTQGDTADAAIETAVRARDMCRIRTRQTLNA